MLIEMKNNRNYTKLLVILLLFLICSLTSINFTRADFKVKVGDTFQFKVTKLRNSTDETFVYTNGQLDIAFTENSNLTVEIVEIYDVYDIPEIKCKIVIDDIYSLTGTSFSGFIFVNRDWEQLEEDYPPPVFESYETRQIWGVTTEIAGEAQIEYVKKDGVLNQFYSKNYTQINSFGIYEILIQRTDVQLGGYTWLSIIPGFLIILTSLRITNSKRKT